MFDSLDSVAAKILVGNNDKVPENVVGLINAIYNKFNLNFFDVIYNPNSPANLISTSKLLKMDCVVREFTLDKIVLFKTCFQIEAIWDKNDLWIILIEVLRRVSGYELRFEGISQGR